MADKSLAGVAESQYGPGCDAGAFFLSSLN
jgi:hypothetical protein